jgi:hypothetical protein
MVSIFVAFQQDFSLLSLVKSHSSSTLSIEGGATDNYSLLSNNKIRGSFLAYENKLGIVTMHLESIMSVMYYVTFGDFLRHACWNIAALDQFRFLQGRTLWFWSSRSGCVATQYGEDVWQLFRYRVRREGAHRRVVTGSILRDRPVRRLLLRPTQQIS